MARLEKLMNVVGCYLRATVVITTGFLICWLSPSVFAQQSSSIEEVVVTAQKREQSLQDVGIAVTAFSATDIRDLGLQSVNDIANQTPSLDIKNARGNTNPIITLRGVGLSDAYTNNNPAVGIYVDQVNLPTSAYLSFQLYDLERIEVLKGPQGTLYGRNTTGGAVNFITAKPTDEFEGYVDVDYGRWNTLNLEGAVSGPLTENLKGRLAIMTVQSDGYLRNRGTIGLNAGLSIDPAVAPIPRVEYDDTFLEQNSKAVRGTLIWTLSDTAEVLFTGHYTRDLSDNYVYKQTDGPDRTGFAPADSDPFLVESNRTPEIDLESWGAAMQIDMDLGFATLTSVTGYDELERHMDDDDGSPYRIQENVYDDAQWTVSEEIRLSANSTGNFFWTTGVFYSHEYVDYLRDVVLLDHSSLRGIVTGTIKQKADSWAVFGQGEWQFSEQFKLTTGLRYAKDKRKFKGTTTDTDPFGTSRNAGIFGLPILTNERFTEGDVSGKVALDWTPMEGVLLYASFSKGFKSGGYDGSTVLVPQAAEPFFGETVFAYEGGLKTTLLDGKLRWNASLFYYDYEDLQAEAALEVIPGTTESVRSNVGDAEILGFESDLWWKPTDGLDFKFAVQVIDTKITKWNSVDAVEVAARVGNKLPDVPELTFSGLARYEWPVFSNKIAAIQTDFNYSDDNFKSIENRATDLADDYFLVNARLSLLSGDGSWDVSLWAKNLTDEIYMLQSQVRSSTTIQTFGAPRSYGISLSYRYQ